MKQGLKKKSNRNVDKPEPEKKDSLEIEKLNQDLLQLQKQETKTTKKKKTRKTLKEMQEEFKKEKRRRGSFSEGLLKYDDAKMLANPMM